jgi:predicted Zn finger-like uncharacterized protein
MRFSCDSCQARYSVADERLHGRAGRVRCKRCGHVIHLSQIGSEVSADASSDRAEWFAAIDQKEVGPLTLDQLQERFRSGLVSLRTYVWKDGFASWKRVRDIPGLAALVPTELLNATTRRAARLRLNRRGMLAASAAAVIVAVALAALLSRRTHAPRRSGESAPVASSEAP